MKSSSSWRGLVCFGMIAVSLCIVSVTRAAPQDPALKPTFGAVELKAGFTPDPCKKELVAGGEIETKKGGFTHWVAKAPDFQLNYKAGGFPLTIYAESPGDTTLLINLPDGTWIADDDSGGMLNPKLKFEKPQSGRYDIWVGTIGKDNAKATLFITEIEMKK